MIEPEPLQRLARESGRLLGELGVRPDDSGWIRAHARSVASLTRTVRPARLLGFVQRLARRAARTAR